MIAEVMVESGHVIAVVEDEESVRGALVRFFKAASFDARAFSSARVFLRSLDDSRFDCLVLDLQMPDMTGLDLQRYLRMIRPELRLPVIVITAHDEPGMREKCFAAGVAAYLPKPVEGAALLAAVEQLIHCPSPSTASGPNGNGHRGEP
jgi:FixJ family two-component response regulator